MIIWIASYPKSGNTWMRSLLSAYLYTDDGNFNFDLLYKIAQFPNKKFLEYFLKDFSDIKKVSDYWIAAQDRINLFNENKTIFLKTHSALCTLENNSFTNKNNTKAVIYVVRDPRNVVTSISNHYSFDIEESFKFITKTNKFLTGEEWGGKDFGIATALGSWANHFKSWQQIKFAPILIIKYENLINDTFNELQKLLIFLKNKCQINKNIDVAKLINSTSFDSLKSFEDKKLLNLSHNKGVKFFNLGKENIWQNNLDKKYVDQIEEKFEKEMIELNYL